MYRHRVEKIFVERFSNLFLLVFAFGICLHCYTIDAAKHTRIALFAGWNRVLQTGASERKIQLLENQSFHHSMDYFSRSFFSNTTRKSFHCENREHTYYNAFSLPTEMKIVLHISSAMKNMFARLANGGLKNSLCETRIGGVWKPHFHHLRQLGLGKMEVFIISTMLLIKNERFIFAFFLFKYAAW